MGVPPDSNYLLRKISAQDNEIELLNNTIQDLRQRLRVAGRPKVVEVTKIPEDKLKRLIMLCHPDRHSQSEMSKEITQWLSIQRSRR